MTTQEKPSTLKTESFGAAQDRPVEVLPVRQLKILYSWKAPSRLFKKRSREFWSTILAIVFLLTVILFFIKEWFLIVVMYSLVFVFYVFTNFPPEEIEHQVTTRGIRFAGREYLWEDFSQYWLSEKEEQKILNFETRLRFPRRLQLLISEEEAKKAKEIIGKYLPGETPSPNFLDKASDWLAKKVPLEG